MTSESLLPNATEALDVSIVVPCYRAAASLPELTAELASALEARGTAFEIVLVNDSSPDDTWSVIEDLADGDARIHGIDLLHNHGQPTATMCGLAATSGTVVVTMDDDLEHRPEELSKLLDALDENPDWDAVVATWPVERSGLRDIGTRIHTFADRLAWGTPRGFRHTAFRAMRRPVCDAVLSHQTRIPLVGPLLHQVSSRVHNVEVDNGVRRHGASGFTYVQGMRMVVRNFTSGSTAPLKLISGLGLVLSLIAFAVGAFLLTRWALGANSPSGWLSSLLAILFVGGMNMLAFGILGNYVDILVREVRRPPRWSLRSTTDGVQIDRLP